MGRWSQRRHGSSAGSGAGPTLIAIELANHPDDFTVFLNYSGDIDAADFDLADFISSPSGESPTTIIQSASNTLELDFTGSTSGDDEIQYTGDAPGVLSPQQIQYV